MFLDEDLRYKIKEIFSELKEPEKIRIIFFKENLNCTTCKEVETLLKEMSEVVSNIELDIYNRYTDAEKSSEYDVKLTPAVFFENSTAKKKIAVYGFPSGYEFITFIEIIKYLSGVNVELEENTLNEISKITKNINLKVFVTPTCPYCPHAAVTAVKLALKSEMIKTEIILVNEFPDLAYRYGVQGVPKTVINEQLHLEGVQPESQYIEAIKSLST